MSTRPSSRPADAVARTAAQPAARRRRGAPSPDRVEDRGRQRRPGADESEVERGLERRRPAEARRTRSPLPSTRDRSRAGADRVKSPRTRGISLIETDCSSRRTRIRKTSTSVAANTTASSAQCTSDHAFDHASATRPGPRRRRRPRAGPPGRATRTDGGTSGARRAGTPEEGRSCPVCATARPPVRPRTGVAAPAARGWPAPGRRPAGRAVPSGSLLRRARTVSRLTRLWPTGGPGSATRTTRDPPARGSGARAGRDLARPGVRRRRRASSPPRRSPWCHCGPDRSAGSRRPIGAGRPWPGSRGTRTASCRRCRSASRSPGRSRRCSVRRTSRSRCGSGSSGSACRRARARPVALVVVALAVVYVTLVLRRALAQAARPAAGRADRPARRAARSTRSPGITRPVIWLLGVSSDVVVPAPRRRPEGGPRGRHRGGAARHRRDERGAEPRRAAAHRRGARRRRPAGAGDHGPPARRQRPRRRDDASRRRSTSSRASRTRATPSSRAAWTTPSASCTSVTCSRRTPGPIPARPCAASPVRSPGCRTAAARCRRSPRCGARGTTSRSSSTSTAAARAS